MYQFVGVTKVVILGANDLPVVVVVNEKNKHNKHTPKT